MDTSLRALPPYGYIGSVVWTGATGSWARVYVSKLVYYSYLLCGKGQRFRDRCEAYFIAQHGSVDHIFIEPTTRLMVA